jgi:hypothetical protein
MPTATPPVMQMILPGQLDPRWARLPGLELSGTTLTINPDYWFQFESQSWVVCDWEGVRDHLLPITETGDLALEQIVLDYIRRNSRVTTDPAVVLDAAWHVYSYLFRDELLPVPSLEAVGADKLRMLREAAILMALNKVDAVGHIANISPSWFFGAAVPVVFDLDDATGQMLDEVYHGTWFNEYRRIESVKAHAALGGRLVHGCQSAGNLSGGVVASYGADMTRFREELAAMRPEWLARIRACRAAG